MVVRQGDKVRVRVGNLTMTNHPIHMHGHEFEVTGTDGGWTRPESRWPEVTTDIAVGQMRAVEFTATDLGDWAFHCHKSHHTMNAMGHDVPTMIGVDHQGVAAKINQLVPGYMVMGERGMADMGEMQMRFPTIPCRDGRRRPSAPSAWAACLPRSRYARTRNRATTATRAGTASGRQRAHEWTGALPAPVRGQGAGSRPQKARGDDGAQAGWAQRALIRLSRGLANTASPWVCCFKSMNCCLVTIRAF